MKVVRFEGGEISVYGRGMVLVPAETIILFHEVLEKEVGREKADQRMVQVGKSLTVESTKRYIDNRKNLRPVFQQTTTGDPSIEMGKQVFRMSGLGDIRIIESAKDAGKYVIGTQSPIAKEHLRTRGKSKAPACSFLMGVIGGVLTGFRGTDYSAREVQCMATGLCNECVFEFRKNPAE